ncbi:hypothetical protein H8E77_42735 [bacterium]|nr:hypothetical protein [bacterium]
MGDAVLGTIICDYGYHNYPHYGIGELTNLKINVVNNSILAYFAIEKLNLPEYIAFGGSIIHDDASKTESILATTLEAIIASIYLDGGLESAKSFVLKILKDKIEDEIKSIKEEEPDPTPFLMQGKQSGNYVNALQEYCQKYRIQLPEYEFTSTGQPPEQIFKAKVTVEGKPYGPGMGPRKRVAQQEAAKIALEELVGDAPKE